MKKLKECIDNITPEEIERYFPKDNTPKGWVSIGEFLPKWLAKDIDKGGSVYKVLYGNGCEDLTIVSDHNSWYYEAKNSGITHWWNA